METTDIDKEIERCQAEALELRQQGYGCAQCVLMSLSDKIGIKKPLAARIAAGFGNGFAGSGGICGVISILGVAEGLNEKGSAPEDKSEVIWKTKEHFDRFRTENEDRFLCVDLKGKNVLRKCTDLIKDSIRIFLEAHPELTQRRRGLLDEIKAALKS